MSKIREKKEPKKQENIGAERKQGSEEFSPLLGIRLKKIVLMILYRPSSELETDPRHASSVPQHGPGPSCKAVKKKSKFWKISISENFENRNFEISKI